MDNMNAQEAVQKAAEGFDGIAVQDELGEERIITNEESQEEDTPEDGEDVSGQEESGEDAEGEAGTDPKSDDTSEVDSTDTKLALELFRAINSPKGPELIKALAQAKGMQLVDAQKTTAEGSQNEVDFTKFVKDRLNPKFGFLAEELGKIFNDYDKLQSQKVSSVQQNAEKAQVGTALQSAMEKFGESVGIDLHDSNNKIANKMVEIGNSMPFTGADPKEYSKYLTRLHKIATSELGVVNEKISKVKKITRNLSASEPEAARGTNPPARQKAPKDITAEDAVKAAIYGISYTR